MEHILQLILIGLAAFLGVRFAERQMLREIFPGWQYPSPPPKTLRERQDEELAEALRLCPEQAGLLRQCHRMEAEAHAYAEMEHNESIQQELERLIDAARLTRA